jgi:hypothetical protein
MANNISKYFQNGIAARDIMDFMGTYNMATQAVAADGSHAYNVQTTGGGACVIDTVLIPALDADAEHLIVTEDDHTDINGLTLADDYEQWFAFFVEADGTLSVKQAGDAAAIGGNAVLKIPDFDPTTYCCVAVCLYANDAASDTVTFGATDGGVAWGTDGTFYQMIGPVFPHPDNIDND